MIYYNSSKIFIRISSIEIGTKFSSHRLPSVGCTRKCCGDAIGDCSTLDFVTLHSAIVSFIKKCDDIYYHMYCMKLIC